MLIVGAGPAGLAMALALARRGVASVVAEHRDGPTPFAAARGVKVFGMEILRRLGVEAAIADLAHPEPKIDISLRPSLFQPGGPRVTVCFGEHGAISPCPARLVGQNDLERVLAAAARATGRVDLRYGTEATEVTVGETRVQATLRRAGSSETIHADWLIAADGRRSGLRNQAGVASEMLTALPDSVSALVTLQAVPPEAEGMDGFILVDPPAFKGVAQPRGGGRFEIAFRAQPGHGPDKPPEATLEDRIADALGPGVAFALSDRRDWAGEDQLAERLRTGRLLLVGDAAAAVTPSAGFSPTLALESISNLGWKLAAVIAGQAPDALLDTYDAEFRPRAREVVAFSVARLTEVPRPDASGRLVSNEVTDGIQLDWTLALDGASVSRIEEAATYRPLGNPGRRAPHLDVIDGGSVLDAIGDKPLLLTGPSDAWPDHPEIARAQAPPEPLKTLYGIPAEGAVLVRPDGVVAWHATTLPPDPEAALRAAVDRLFARTGAIR